MVFFSLVLVYLVFVRAAEAAPQGRDNPFLPQNTPAEDKVITERNLIAQTVREMIPEILQAGSATLDHERQATIDEIRRQQSQAQAMLTQTRTRDSGSSLKGTVTFISCVHGKALYRDSATHKTAFAKAGSEAQQVCDPQ